MFMLFMRNYVCRVMSVVVMEISQDTVMNFMKKVLPFSPSCALYRSPTEGTQQHGQGVAISRRHHSGGYGGSPPIWKPWTAMHMIVLYTHSDSQIPRNKVCIDYLIFLIFYFIYDYLFWSRSSFVFLFYAVSIYASHWTHMSACI